MMRIGIDGRAAKWYRGTGIGTYTYELINSLNKIDFTNKYNIFLPYGSATDINFNSSFTIKSISTDPNNNFWNEVNIPNILSDSNIDIYHVPQNGIGLPMDKKCPFIITLHDVIPYKMPETVGKEYLKIFTRDMPKIIEKCDGIITVSDFSKNDIVKTFNFPKEKIYVTYLAAENIYYPKNINESKKVAESYGIDEEYILYIGGFSPRKNIIGLIEGFSILLKHYKKKIKLVIAGKHGISYETYRKRAEDLGILDSVLFPGFIKLQDLPYLYTKASLFAYPSFYEGFGLPPIEAMACGTPVISSNITSIPEVLGDSALLVNPKDVYEIAAAMEQILEDDSIRNLLKAKGIIKSSSLSFDKTAIKTIEAYDKTINT